MVLFIATEVQSKCPFLVFGAKFLFSKKKIFNVITHKFLINVYLQTCCAITPLLPIMGYL